MESVRLIRFERKRETRFGILDNNSVYRIDGKITADFKKGEKVCGVEDVNLLPPVVPRTVVGVGANYYSVLNEVGMEIPKEPALFLKAASCVIGCGDAILHPRISEDLRFESEIAVIIKKEAKFVPEDKALDYILGYTCANDLTLHDINERFPTRNKSFYTSCPLGPCITTGIDGDQARIMGRLNGRSIADASSNGMVFNISQIISYITAFMPLEPFDVILTGTPHKGLKLREGDHIEIEIEGIGILENRVQLIE